MKIRAQAELRRRWQRLRRPFLVAGIHRARPVSDDWGFDRGTPVDRFYIERFLEQERGVIRGRVLEVLNADYTRRFGACVDRSDVLDIDATNHSATIVADLSAADPIADAVFDCFILTQTLQYIYDVGSAVQHAHRILRPGGTLLVTVPSVTRMTPGAEASEYWRFTEASCKRLFCGAFAVGEVAIRSYGNVSTAVSFLVGAAAEELRRRELELRDPRFPVVIAVKATKAG